MPKWPPRRTFEEGGSLWAQRLVRRCSCIKASSTMQPFSRDTVAKLKTREAEAVCVFVSRFPSLAA